MSKTLDNSEMYSIDKTSKEGTYILYFGQNETSDRYNICTLSCFDGNGDANRMAIVESLNNTTTLEKEVLNLRTEVSTLKKEIFLLKNRGTR